MRSFRLAALLPFLAACADPGPSREHVDALFRLDPRAVAPRTTAELAAAGERLFATRLGDAACADCHVPAQHGQDGKVHGRATPALVDVSRQLLFGWDGAARDLSAVVAQELRLRCGVAEPASGDVAALTAYLGNWRTRGRWDRYVEGDEAALTAHERHGLATFVEVGCAACHAGRTLGGRSQHVLGAAVPYPSADTGLHAATGREADRGVWRAPMLRLAARTGPWLHDGSIDDLDEVIRLMAKHELGREVDAGQVAAIAAFLRAVADVDT